MKSILDLATIKIKPTGETRFLAKVILNWNEEFEVRFCRITRRADGTLWFQPPALMSFGWAKCFAVIKAEDWHRLEKRVLEKFFEIAREEKLFSDEFIIELESMNSGKEDINPDEVLK